MKRTVPWVTLMVLSAVICATLWISLMQANERFEQRKAAMSAGWTPAIAQLTGVHYTKKWHFYRATFSVVAKDHAAIPIERITHNKVVSPSYSALIHQDGRVWTALDGVPNPTEPTFAEGNNYALIWAIALTMVLTAIFAVVVLVKMHQAAQVSALRRKRRQAGIIEISGSQLHLQQLLDQLDLVPASENPELAADLRLRIKRLMQINNPGNLFVIKETVNLLEAEVPPDIGQAA